MKKYYLFIAALLVMGMTSMMLTEKNDGQPTTSFPLENNQPIFYKGMITIKVKEGIKDLGKQKGNISFNIPSLDAKAQKYKVDLLDKSFRYNPKKLKKGMPDLSRIYRIEFPEEYPVTKVVREFSSDPNIEYAEPIPIPQPLVVPNDPMYGDLHHLTQIKAEEAWEIHKGEDGPEDIIIAIVDSGTEWDHEDLVDNIWQNMGEDVDGDGHTIEFNGSAWIFDPDDDNGIDDDGNGYTDDLIGWNFFLDNNDPNPIPGTFMWEHGTLMGGYASASTNNNIGVASISWNLKIMPVQAGWESLINQSYNAIIYAAENGADVISNSWGYYDFFSQANYEAIIYARSLGSIILGGTANDNQYRLMYPAAYPGVLGVAALNQLDEKASYSNYGPHVAISAPGGDGSGSSLLLSTYVNNTYYATCGTSCATPIVAGLMGLVKSYHPEWTSDQVITQVLGTAYGIDSINPDYENQLGAGRIHALWALDSTEVELQQEIAIDLFSFDFQDSDGNHMAEQGDTIQLSLKFINYNFGVGAEDALFTISTTDPDIILLNSNYTCDIPADDYFTLEEAFEIVIVDETVIHQVTFELMTSADKEITWGSNISFDLLVEPEGILVFEGEGTGNTYSGDYFNDYLTDQGFDVFYTNHFPLSLLGFEAAFLSYGNHGIRFREGTPVTIEMEEAIIEYLYQGGKIYVECGSFFGSQYHFGYPAYDEIIELFGIAETLLPAYSNPINLLTGLDNSICHELEFTGSTQNFNNLINIFNTTEFGVAAFEEENFGTVAVQGEGEFGQKTFCFSYALGHLVDNPQGSRDTLLNRIVVFFDLYDPIANFIADSTDIVEGDTVHFTDLSQNNPTGWEWHFEGGNPETSTEQNPIVVYNTAGIYDVSLIVSNTYGPDTLMRDEYIIVSIETGEEVDSYPTELILYPNPAQDNLLISSTTDIRSVMLLNNAGETVIRQNVNTKRMNLDITDLPAGIYYIRLQTTKTMINRKVIKIN
ncbi:MAG: S8 family serine peptidase [Bacteroidetes bacterium]|nr:S8 family serine peptidase [Bacteroidota bacterium]